MKNFTVNGEAFRTDGTRVDIYTRRNRTWRELKLESCDPRLQAAIRRHMSCCELCGRPGDHRAIQNRRVCNTCRRAICEDWLSTIEPGENPGHVFFKLSGVRNKEMENYCDEEVYRSEYYDNPEDLAELLTRVYNQDYNSFKEDADWLISRGVRVIKGVKDDNRN